MVGCRAWEDTEMSLHGEELVERALIAAINPDKPEDAVEMLERIRGIVDSYLKRGYQMQLLTRAGTTAEAAFEVIKEVGLLD